MCAGVWCPVCNQGFTRHYNLKVHMYKSHGKEYLENNFSQEELESIMRPPPGSNTSKPSPTPRKRSDEEIVIPGTPTGVLPISPPLTPKLSPKQKLRGDSESSSPTMVPSNSIIPSANILKANLQAGRSRPGPASLTKPQHYFDQEAQTAVLRCQFCDEKFLRSSDLYIHLGQHGLRVTDSQLTSTHGQTVTGRRPGPASRTNAPKENRAGPMSSSNLPGHVADHCQDSPGFPCHQCGKVLMHKQSYVSHMRVIHGDYYGGNKWKGSSVVELVLGGQKQNSNKRPAGGAASYNDYKFGLACEFCNKAFTDQAHLEEHIQCKHPNLTKRIEAFKAALGLNDSNDEPDTKRIKLDYQGILKDQNENSLSSYSIISFPTAHAQLSGADGYNEPLDLACKPVSLNVEVEDEEEERFVADGNNNQNHSNNLLQIAPPPASSSPCSPLNLHISRPTTPAPSPQQASQASPSPAASPAHDNTEEHGDSLATDNTAQPQKLHEYLVKQSNATSDENGRKKFLCPVCKCQLSWKTNLSVHLRTHSGERPFQCVLCLNRFRQKAHLYKHFRCSHGHKVSPYNCMFCTESYSRSPNDLYNHITEVHKRETDELTNNNNLISNNNNVKTEFMEKSKEEEEDEVQPENLSQEKEKTVVDQGESKNEEDEEDAEEDHQPKDRTDDVRFEAIQEEFEFDGKIIKPSYCVLPFVTDEEVEACTKRNIAVRMRVFFDKSSNIFNLQEYYEEPEDYSEDEEGQMVIDEGPLTPENLILAQRNEPAAPVNLSKNNFNNNELKINSFGQGFANAINIW